MDGNLFCLGGVGVIFVLVALFIALRALKDWRLHRESENWIPVSGQIAASHVTADQGSEGGITYRTFISYTYQVMGQSYQSNQFSFGSEGTGYGTRKKAEEVIARYPLGGQTAVYYDPNNPSQAVLERKYDVTGAILGVIFGLAGAGIVIYAYLQYLRLGK